MSSVNMRNLGSLFLLLFLTSLLTHVRVQGPDKFKWLTHMWNGKSTSCFASIDRCQGYCSRR